MVKTLDVTINVPIERVSRYTLKKTSYLDCTVKLLNLVTFVIYWLWVSIGWEGLGGNYSNQAIYFKTNSLNVLSFIQCTLHCHFCAQYFMDVCSIFVLLYILLLICSLSPVQPVPSKFKTLSCVCKGGWDRSQHQIDAGGHGSESWRGRRGGDSAGI